MATWKLIMDILTIAAYGAALKMSLETLRITISFMVVISFLEMLMDVVNVVNPIR